MAKVYEIPVVWSMMGKMRVEVEDDQTMSSAVKKAIRSEPLPSDANYVEDSARIDGESLADCNPDVPSSETATALADAAKKGWLG